MLEQLKPLKIGLFELETNILCLNHILWILYLTGLNIFSIIG
jgi:hypothetical protein